jgi:hypothetical protein
MRACPVPACLLPSPRLPSLAVAAHKSLERSLACSLRSGPAGWEDGTPAFLDFPAVLAGFRFMERLGGFPAVAGGAAAIAPLPLPRRLHSLRAAASTSRRQVALFDPSLHSSRCEIASVRPMNLTSPLLPHPFPLARLQLTPQPWPPAWRASWQRCATGTAPRSACCMAPILPAWQGQESQRAAQARQRPPAPSRQRAGAGQGRCCCHRAAWARDRWLPSTSSAPTAPTWVTGEPSRLPACLPACLRGRQCACACGAGLQLAVPGTRPASPTHSQTAHLLWPCRYGPLLAAWLVLACFLLCLPRLLRLLCFPCDRHSAQQ